MPPPMKLIRVRVCAVLSFFVLRLISFGFVVVCCLLVRAPVLRRGFVLGVFVLVVVRCLVLCFSLFLVFLVFVLSFGLLDACSCRALSLVRLVCLRWFWGVSVVFLRGLWFCAKSGRGCTLKL